MKRDKPKLLVTTSTLPRHEGDTEPRFVLDLARNMQGYFDVTILAPSFPGARPRDPLMGIEVLRYRYAPRQIWERVAYPGGIMPRLRANPGYWALVPCLLAGQWYALRRLLRTEAFDVVHAHWTLPQGLLAAAHASMGVPFVTTAHGGDVHTVGSRLGDPLLRFVMRRAAAVTVVSEELQQRLFRLGGTTRDKIRNISMGVDFQHFSTAALGAQMPQDLPEGGPLILFVGRLTGKKGLHVLIDALALGIPELGKAHLAVVGEGPALQGLVKRIRERGLEDRVRFLGARSHDDLPAYFAAADVFALPCVQSEDGDKDGLPVTLMEGAACGVPAVASSIGGIPQFVRDGENGLLVPPGDARALALALGRVLGSRELRQRLGHGAAETARSFDWAVIARRHAEVLLSVMEKSVRNGFQASQGDA